MADKTHNVLVADDDESIRFLMSELLKKEGLDHETVSDGRTAFEKISSGAFSLAVIDEKMPGMNGLEILSKLKAEGISIPVIMITAFGSRALAMRAVEEGAYDFFTKPVDLPTVRTVIHRAIEKFDLQKEIAILKAELVESEPNDEIVDKSPSMHHALELARKVADTGVTVFISGESGSGKEVVARAIHRMSARHDGLFVSVNCAAIPDGLLESELFGYERGAFTGAQKQHIGKFERSSGGTIFLDEIGDLSSALQAKLLRVLQEKAIERLGGKNPIPVDIRVISATNKNIPEMILRGEFREDLLYRIRVFEIEVPPLRKRREDLPLLCARMVAKYSAQMGRRVKGLSASALETLLAHDWPGNVRELENVLQRAIIVEPGEIISDKTLVAILGETATSPMEPMSSRLKLGALKDEEERKMIAEALAKTGWRRQETAKLLGMSRKSLYIKMKKLGLSGGEDV